jgi:hypothetical protein
MTEPTLEELANQTKTVETPATTDTIATFTTPALSPEIAALVGEGKKYATVDLALASIAPAQAHIEKLEAAANSRETVETLLEEIKINQAKGTTAPEKVGLGQNDVDALINQRLAQREVHQTQTTNVDTVQDAFVSKFGVENANIAYAKVAKDANLSVLQLHEITKAAPAIVLKLAGLATTAPITGGKIESDVNTQSLDTNNADGTLSAKVDPKLIGNSKAHAAAWQNAGVNARKKLGIT